MNSTLRHRRRPRANKRARPLCGCVCVLASFLSLSASFLPALCWHFALLVIVLRCFVLLFILCTTFG